MYKYLMFDLDGTLVESGRSIISSAKYSLEKLGKEPLSEEDLLKFIGPPLFVSFTNLCGMDEKEADEAIEVYREHYDEIGYKDSPLYPDIIETLDELKKCGKELLVVTSKPENIANKVIDMLGIRHYFIDVIGPSEDEKTLEKAELIKRAFEKNNIKDHRLAVMIGDRKFDIEAANKNGIDSIGVLYGYGSLEEFEKAGATKVAKNGLEIVNAVS